MGGGSPPFKMGEEMWGGLGAGPGAARQSCHPMADGQIHSLQTSGVQLSREAEVLQRDPESGLCPKAHHVRDPNQLAPPATLFHLAGDQTRRSPPSKGFGPTTPYVWPLSNMRWETQRRRN